MTHEDIKAIKEEVLEEADRRYVMVSDCNDRRQKNDEKFAHDDKRIDLVMHDFKIIKWLLATMASATIGALVVSVLDLIVR